MSVREIIIRETTRATGRDVLTLRIDGVEITDEVMYVCATVKLDPDAETVKIDFTRQEDKF